MNVYLAGDLHLGHRNICQYREVFEDLDAHDEAIYDMLSDSLGKKNPLWLLGDIAFTKEAIETLAKFNTKRIKLVLGNHDVGERGIKISDWVQAGFTDIYGLVKYKEFWMSHAPIHTQALRGCHNIHGHLHDRKVIDDRYTCVSLEHSNYELFTLESIRQRIENNK